MKKKKKETADTIQLFIPYKLSSRPIINTDKRAQQNDKGTIYSVNKSPEDEHSD